MVNAARARIRSMGGDPNRAAARVLFEILSEEDTFEGENGDPSENHFETLVASIHEENHDEVDDMPDETQPEEPNEPEDPDFLQAGEQ